MDDRPVNSFVKKIGENTRKVFSSAPKDNGVNCLPRKSCTSIKIKEEETGDEIQEYAATAMSELLGWYGYEKVDSGCTKSLNLDHFTTIPNAKSSQIFQIDQDIVPSKLTLKSPSVNSSNSVFEVSSIPLSYSTSNLMSMNKQLISSPLPLKPVSLESTSKIPYESYSNPTDLENMSCSWCGRISQTCESERSNSLSCNMMDASGHFCSEACFAAGRKAVFKRGKTCDWCRHMRNPINYVDLQDSENQLQFCSNKCLNQYKINIFCHETQTHLMLQGLNNVSFHDTEKGGLITPELWFRSCQSPLNSPTEDTYLVDTHLTHSLSSPLHDNKITETEQNFDNEKSIDLNQKVSKRKDSMYMRKYTKSNCNGQKRDIYAEINENNINEHVKQQTLINKKNKCCHFMINQAHCKVNYAEKDDLNCRDLKKECMMDVINHNTHYENSNTFLERNIHVKDIKNLQENKHDSSSENMLQSPSYFINSTAPIMHHEIPLLSKSCTDESSQTKHQKQTVSPRTSSSKQSNQTELFHSLSTTILPPVTVLIPYPLPIPIPIPIPIPVPISTAIFSKLLTDKEDSLNIKDSNCKNMECKNSIENKCSVPDNSQIRTSNVSTTESLPQVTSDKFCFSSSLSKPNNETNDDEHYLQQNTKLLRKRKRSNEIINRGHEKIQLKKRNKFIAT